MANPRQSAFALFLIRKNTETPEERERKRVNRLMLMLNREYHAIYLMALRHGADSPEEEQAIETYGALIDLINQWHPDVANKWLEAIDRKERRRAGWRQVLADLSDEQRRALLSGEGL